MFNLKSQNGVKFYTSDIFPEKLKHCFTTRIGGIAPPPLDGFSLGTAQFIEHKDYVEKNIKILCLMLDVCYTKLQRADQKHTDNIHIIESNKNVSSGGYLDNTDAIIIAQNSIPSLMYFADCVPILLYDWKQDIFSTVHAGWKGTAKKIVKKTVDKFITEFNSNPKDIIAAIGPSIDICCFKVGENVADQLLSTIQVQADDSKFIYKEEDAIYISLRQINAEQLKESGLKKIDIINECTYCNNKLFFSHRYNNGLTGRQGLIAQLN